MFEAFGKDLNELFENAALAAALGTELGISKENILKAFKTFSGVAGRQEWVMGAGRRAVIDYALTAESLEALYAFLKKKMTTEGKNGKLIAVFGSAGGGRDTWKRPVLGETAARFADHIYLTSDDVYDEDPKEIINGIAKGIAEHALYTVLIDRTEAIRTALARATSADIVAITGMGSQQNTYGPGGKKISWSDRKITEEILRSL